MQREAYSPTTTSASADQNQTQSTSNAFPSQSGKPQGPKIHYLCATCETDCYVARDEPLRCHECGGRMMKKTETKAQKIFEAR